MSRPQRALLELRTRRLAGGNSQNVEIVQLVRRLRPERLEHGSGVGVALGEEVAKSQKVACLVGIGRIVHHGFKGSDGGAKIVLPVVDQADVETNSRDLRRQMFGFVQHLQRLRPLLAPHGDDAQVGISAGGLRIQRQDAAKGTLGRSRLFFFRALRPRETIAEESRLPSRAAPDAWSARPGAARECKRKHREEP